MPVVPDNGPYPWEHEPKKLVGDAIILERAARVLDRRTSPKGRKTFAYKLNRKVLLRVAARLRQEAEEVLDG